MGRNVLWLRMLLMDMLVLGICIESYAHRGDMSRPFARGCFGNVAGGTNYSTAKKKIELKSVVLLLVPQTRMNAW